jgi:predicted secreted hydrolase
MIGAALALGALLLVVVAVRGVIGGGDARIAATLPLTAAMAADTSGFARATGPAPFAFPADHGPHPEFATEWWYVTGNVRTEEGRAFGYQLTFFRKALAADAPARESAWAADQAYMAHFAVTDAAAGTFHAFDRFARGALGLAGAQAAPLRVWLHDWRAHAAATDGAPPADPAGGQPPRAESSPAAAAFPVRLVAAEGGVAIELLLDAGKRPVLQGDAGLSRKGPEPGNASYYYSLTRLPTRGTLRIGGDTFDVAGTSWLDREWSTSGLSPDVVGWDWFALQLGDSTELMLYRLRNVEGGITRFTGGSFTDAAGVTRILDADDATVDVLDSWTSPHTGTRYPARWRVRVPSEALDVSVTPILADQELRLAVRYWEGAVRIQGERRGRALRGVGYVELTGYGERSGNADLRRGR